MKKFFITAIFFLTIAHAQYNYGLVKEVDEFTQDYSCSQRVDNSSRDDTGILLMYSDFFGYGLVIIRDFKNDRNSWVFSSASETPRPGDMVYIRFDDGEIVSGAPDFVFVETSPQRVDAAGFYADEIFVLKLLLVNEDVRVRFIGINGQRDFTIKKEVFFSLANEFGKQCMGISKDGTQG